MIKLNKAGIKFKCINQPLIDTTTPHGEFIFKLFAILAEHERKRLIHRTNIGLAAARSRGRNGGRPKGLSPHYTSITDMVKSAYEQKKSIREIMKAFKIPSTATVYKILSQSK